MGRSSKADGTGGNVIPSESEGPVWVGGAMLLLRATHPHRSFAHAQDDSWTRSGLVLRYAQRKDQDWDWAFASLVATSWATIDKAIS